MHQGTNKALCVLIQRIQQISTAFGAINTFPDAVKYLFNLLIQLSTVGDN